MLRIRMSATRWVLTIAGATLLLSASACVVAQELNAARDALGTVAIFLETDDKGDTTKLSEFWIGIDGTPADETLRAQLELADGRGVVVNQVVPESPAAKAGLERFDVLFAVGNKPLGDIADLAAIISAEKDKPLMLRLVRRAKQIVVEVKPERRPLNQTGETCPQISRIDDPQYIRRVFLDLVGLPPTDNEVKQFVEDSSAEKRSQLTLRLLRQTNQQDKSCTACHRQQDEQGGAKLLIQWLTGQAASQNPTVHPYVNQNQLDHAAWRALGFVGQNQPNRLTLAYPAVIDVNASVDLPDDLTVSVIRQGKQPIRVRVTKGEESWETTGDKLDQLPESVRPHVEQVLGVRRNAVLELFDYGDRITNIIAAPAQAQQPEGEPSAKDESKVVPNLSSSAIDRLDQQLEKFRTEVDDLRRSMQDLRKSLSTQPDPSASERK